MKTDTIAAIATAVSNAGISIIRISGNEAIAVIDKIFKPKNENKKITQVESHTVHYGYIVDEELIIDEVLVVIMKAPNSYTKEDIVEIDCHGGNIVTRKVLETVIKNGARTAEPGEFTKRAFLNGRIDLSKAEAVIDIINAKNEYALKNSMKQLKGNVFSKVQEIRENIIHDLAFLEAALDDPEHISLDHYSEDLYMHVNSNIEEINKLINDSNNGRFLTEGIQTVILGKPNAGKSSLLNALLGAERAIVTDIAGTTRDTLEETVQIGSITLNIIDTAGIRDTEDLVEKIGVSRAKKAALESDLIIYVIDASTELDRSDMEIIELIKDRTAVVLMNKSDLTPAIDISDIESLTGKEILKISAKDEVGIDLIEQWIMDKFFEGEIRFNDEVYITNLRQKEALIESAKSLKLVKKSIEDCMPEDFFSIDLMNSYEYLGNIIGESVDEDLVNTIFREFCMGK